MSKNKSVVVLVAVVLIVWTGHADNIRGINMDFVTIGNAGNVTNSDGFGRVTHDYRIGSTEVSIEQFLASPVSGGDPDFWNDGVRQVGVAAPVTKVSWYQAAQFCNYLTSGNVYSGAYQFDGGGNLINVMNRASIIADGGTFYVLPTQDEWYKTAYYRPVNDGSYSLYANGSDTTAPVDETDALYGRDSDAGLGGSWEIGMGPWTVGSGSGEQNGTINMMGNVWEWLETPADGILNPGSDEDMVFRGGSYFQNLLQSSQTGTSESQAGAWSNTGFRVVAIPEPGTISLMGMSTAGLFITRRLRRRKLVGRSILPVGHEHFCDAFCSEDEWHALNEVAETPDALLGLKQAAKAMLLDVFGMVHSHYKALDRIVWNHMVVSHERGVLRRKAFWQALKKKALDCFDAFLALVMK
jgi:hypothetical protein